MVGGAGEAELQLLAKSMYAMMERVSGHVSEVSFHGRYYNTIEELNKRYYNTIENNNIKVAL